MMTRLARGRTLGRVAADLGLQLDEVGEDVGLAPQFVGDHRRLARNRRDHGHADAAALHRFDQRAEIAVTGEQHDLVDMFGEFHGIDRELDIHVALDLAAAGGVDEFFGRLGDDGEAVVIEPVDQGTDRRIFLIFDDRGVVERAQQRAAALEFLEKALVVDVEAERLRRRIKMKSAILLESNDILIMTKVELEMEANAFPFQAVVGLKDTIKFRWWHPQENRRNPKGAAYRAKNYIRLF